MPLVARGYDCSWDPPDQQCMKNTGYTFLVRYGSRDPSKNLTKAELDAALSKGLFVCVVWQEGKTQMLRGYGGGQTDALDADEFVNSLGLYGIPLYFSADWDVQSSEQADVHAYLDGVASVIGRARTGIYGGYPAVSKALNAGKATWAWQCFAWSGTPTNWDARAQLRQVKIDYARCSGTIDDDEAWASDFGQWPRPGGGPQEGGMMSASCAISGGQRYYACIWSDGKVNYRGPDTGGKWWACDPTQSPARSGACITVTSDGRVIIAYTNGAGVVCTYERAPGGSTWGWASLGGDAK